MRNPSKPLFGVSLITRQPSELRGSVPLARRFHHGGHIAQPLGALVPSGRREHGDRRPSRAARAAGAVSAGTHHAAGRNDSRAGGHGRPASILQTHPGAPGTLPHSGTANKKAAVMHPPCRSDAPVLFALFSGFSSLYQRRNKSVRRCNAKAARPICRGCALAYRQLACFLPGQTWKRRGPLPCSAPASRLP